MIKKDYREDSYKALLRVFDPSNQFDGLTHSTFHPRKQSQSNHTDSQHTDKHGPTIFFWVSHITICEYIILIGATVHLYTSVIRCI
jgi:hypothetical protein